MHKICFITTTPSFYKIKLFRLLSKHFQLTILFKKKIDSEYDESWHSFDFGNYNVNFLTKSVVKNFKLLKSISKNCDLLINGDYTNINSIILTELFKKNKKPTILLADGGLAIDRGFFNKIISFIMKRNDYFMSSGLETNKYFNFYGVNQEKIFNYHFTSIDGKYLKKAEQLLQINLRKNYSIKDSEFILLSSGRTIPRKGYDLLLEAMSKVRNNIKLIIVGGESNRQLNRIINDYQLSNIHFYPFLKQEELMKLYSIADCFVLPTRYDIWGLVINEAIAFKLPIISTNKCVAAIEIDNLFNNAIIYEVEDTDALAAAIDKVYEDKELRILLSKNSHTASKLFTLEKTRDDFIEIINKII